jgi:hypothetical protein
MLTFAYFPTAAIAPGSKRALDEHGKNARTTVHGRAILVKRIETVGWGAGKAAGVSLRTAYKWLGRYRAVGERMLQDGSSTPARCRHRRAGEIVAEIERLTRQRLTIGGTSRLPQGSRAPRFLPDRIPSEPLGGLSHEAGLRARSTT